MIACHCGAPIESTWYVYGDRRVWVWMCSTRHYHYWPERWRSTYEGRRPIALDDIYLFAGERQS